MIAQARAPKLDVAKHLNLTHKSDAMILATSVLGHKLAKGVEVANKPFGLILATNLVDDNDLTVYVKMKFGEIAITPSPAIKHGNIFEITSNEVTRAWVRTWPSAYDQEAVSVFRFMMVDFKLDKNSILCEASGLERFRAMCTRLVDNS